MPVSFSDVQTILNGAIAGWKAKNGRDPHLSVHGPNFGWATRQQLLDAVGFDFRLIEPSMIGNGQGDQTNLVIALRDPDGVSFMEQMPRGGPYLSTSQINQIIEWIDAGCPE